MWSGVWPGVWTTWKGTEQNSTTPSRVSTVSSTGPSMWPLRSSRLRGVKALYTALYMVRSRLRAASPAGRHSLAPYQRRRKWLLPAWSTWTWEQNTPAGLRPAFSRAAVRAGPS